MTDQEFLSYVRAHARTERALFHTQHIMRLFDLAGREVPPGLPPTGFVAMRDVDALVDAALARLG